MIVPQDSNNNNNQNHNNNIYEPKSVLDYHRTPSPVATEGNKKRANKGNSVYTDHEIPNNHNNEAALEWDEQVFQNLDWDSITDLGLNDDSAPPFNKSDLMIIPHPTDNSNNHHHHHHHHNLNLNYDDNYHYYDDNIGFDFIEDLIRVADCVDSDDPHLAEAILDRLDQRVRSTKPVGRPLQRAAFMFKEALQALILAGHSNKPARLSSWSDIVQTIKAYKDFSAISPIPMFTHFTTNQAILEALGGSAFIHVIDFDLGLGAHYASLMRELADNNNSNKSNSPLVLRVTAVVPEELAVESRLVRERLIQFAQELKIRFQVEFVTTKAFEAVSFKSIKIIEGERLGVLLSAGALGRVSLGDLRRISPAVVVFVDAEGSSEYSEAQTVSFRGRFVRGLEFYSMVIESVEAAMVGAELARKIETFVMKPRVLAALESALVCGRKTASFREAFHVAGFRAVQLSQFSDFQAECLVGKVQVRGFHVAKLHNELVLCWHDRAIVSTSVWRC